MNKSKRTIISVLLTIAVMLSFVSLAVEVNSGGWHAVSGVVNWLVEIAALSVLVYKHLNDTL